MNENVDRYADIIDLPHHVSEHRTPLSPESRAAQFAPFAALTGYEEAIAAASSPQNHRHTDRRSKHR